MIRQATKADVAALAEVLVDAVQSGASVSFMADFSRSDAEAHFERWISDPARVVLVAVEDGRIEGTAQLLLGTPPNQPHRAELAKMLVHRRARRRGLGGLLFDAICAEGRGRKRTLLTFDTVTGDAGEKLYLSKGAVAVGVIPDYAYFPDGRLCATTVFYKRL